MGSLAVSLTPQSLRTLGLAVAVSMLSTNVFFVLAGLTLERSPRETVRFRSSAAPRSVLGLPALSATHRGHGVAQ